MSAFYVFHTSVKDQDKFQTYAKAVPATLATFGGEVALRGKVSDVVLGEQPHATVGVLRFPDQDAAKRWYESEAYQALIPNRDAAASMTIVRYDAP